MPAGWQRTRRISSREWLDFFRAQLALAAAVLTLRLRSRGSLLSYQSEPGPRSAQPAELNRAAELEQALHRAVRYGPLQPKCLARSVALHRLLQSAHIKGSRIHIGVRPEQEKLAAHAWVTLADQVLGDDPRFIRRFTEIAEARMTVFE
jgi:Transglutaminase-like superfamily